MTGWRPIGMKSGKFYEEKPEKTRYTCRDRFHLLWLDP